MATPQSNEGFLANNLVTMYDLDPDATSATEIAWVDMRDFKEITFSFFRTVGTSDVTWRVLANADSAGGGTDVVIATKTVDPDAVGDYAFQTVTAEQIAQEAADAGVSGVRYVTLEITLATDSDEAVITYIRSQPRFAYTSLTSDVIA